jgi:hypothetical protein
MDKATAGSDRARNDREDSPEITKIKRTILMKAVQQRRKAVQHSIESGQSVDLTSHPWRHEN